jgi:hypothetical protein
MKTLFEKLQALMRKPPQFKWKYLMLKCPDFIVNAFMGKSEIKPEKTESFLDCSSAIFVESSELNVYQFQPEYQ